MSLFATKDVSNNVKVKETKPPRLQVSNTINHMYMQSNELSSQAKYSLNAVDKLLENEVQINKADTWNKLDNTMKNNLLQEFADVYANEQGLSDNLRSSLKTFFCSCLEKNKLQRSKDVNYNKSTKTISSIPALHLNSSNQAFTLKIIDTKRVSTVKSLTPLRTTNGQVRKAPFGPVREQAELAYATGHLRDKTKFLDAKSTSNDTKIE